MASGAGNFVLDGRCCILRAKSEAFGLKTSRGVVAFAKRACCFGPLLLVFEMGVIFFFERKPSTSPEHLSKNHQNTEHFS